MSREVIIAAWCDRCEAQERGKVAATHTYTVGLVKGENRPALRVLELCDGCDPMLADLFDLLAKNTVPLDPPPKVVAGDEATCRICGKSLSTVASVVGHVWSQHRHSARPPVPARCPECRQAVPSQGMGNHRKVHGWSALEEAYEGLPLR